MNRNYLKYILIGGVSIFVWTGCDDYLNRESTSGVNTPDLAKSESNHSRIGGYV